jgi:hypothetical protein
VSQRNFTVTFVDCTTNVANRKTRRQRFLYEGFCCLLNWMKARHFTSLQCHSGKRFTSVSQRCSRLEIRLSGTPLATEGKLNDQRCEGTSDVCSSELNGLRTRVHEVKWVSWEERADGLVRSLFLFLHYIQCKNAFLWSGPSLKWFWKSTLTSVRLMNVNRPENLIGKIWPNYFSTWATIRCWRLVLHEISFDYDDYHRRRHNHPYGLGLVTCSISELLLKWLISSTFGTTLWTGDQPDARPLRTHDSTTQKDEDKLSCLSWTRTHDSNNKAVKTYALDRAATMMGSFNHSQKWTRNKSD